MIHYASTADQIRENNNCGQIHALPVHSVGRLMMLNIGAGIRDDYYMAVSYGNVWLGLHENIFLPPLKETGNLTHI